MTVLDTSVVIDFLLGTGVAVEIEALLEREGTGAAPDVLVFEVLAVLRREVARGTIAPARAHGAVEDVGDLQVELFSSLALRQHAWSRRENLTAADALFVALAEQLDEPLATKDRGLATAARELAGIATLELD